MRRQNKSSAEINWHTDLDIITISDTFISSCRNKYPDRNLKPSETFCRNKNKSSAESHQHTDRKAITVNIYLAISDTLFLSCRNSFSVIKIKIIKLNIGTHLSRCWHIYNETWHIICQINI